MKTVFVIRDTIGRSISLGNCLVKDSNNMIIFESQCLEKGWRNNIPNVSCIPTGKYPLRLEWSPNFKTNLWEIYNVPNRRECKFHAANYVQQLNGCIALGKKRQDLNDDGYTDITESKSTMKKFHIAMKGERQAILHVINSRVS